MTLLRDIVLWLDILLWGGGHDAVEGHIAVEGYVIIRANESYEDELLFDSLDRRLGSDDNVNAHFIQAEVDGAAEPTVVYTDSEDSQRVKGSHLETDSDDNRFDADKEVKNVINSFDNNIELGTTQLTNYLEQYEYKVGADGKYRLKLGHVLRDVIHFREILNKVMARKMFAIKTVYSELRRFVATCKQTGCPWYVVGAKMNDRSGFILWEYNKKHDYRPTNKSVKVTFTWVATKIKNQVVVDPKVKIDILKYYMQETFRLKIKKMTL